MANYTLAQALSQYNADQVQTANMWYIQPINISEPVLERMQIYGKGFTVPDRTNEFGEVKYRGYSIPTPTTLAMGNTHSMDVVADASGELRNAFLNWQARAIDPGITKGLRMSFGADRRPTAGVGGSGLRMYLLAPDYEDVESIIRIWGVRISKVGELAFSNESGDILSFNVEFRSVYWEYEKIQNPGQNANLEIKMAKGADYVPAGGTNANQSMATVNGGETTSAALRG